LIKLDFGSKTFAINPNILTIGHMIYNDIDFSQIYIPKYFPPIYQNDKKNELSEFLTEKVFSLFEKELDYSDKHYLYFLIDRINNWMIDITLKYYNLINNIELADKNIYAGTGANYYTRVLGQVAKDQGGHLHCFEHGEGKFLYNSSETDYTELGVADRFYTFTNESRKLFEKRVTNSTLIFDEKKFIATKIGAAHLKFNKNKTMNKIFNYKKIIYVCKSFLGNKVSTEVRVHDTVYLEWQQYICTQLCQKGFDVFIKYHPGTILLNKKFEIIKNVTYLYGHLSQYLDEDCTFLIDHPMSTTFGELLLANKQVVFIKMIHPDMHDEVFCDLEKSINVIEAFYDENNRIRVDIESLNAILIDGVKHYTSDFIKKYYLND